MDLDYKTNENFYRILEPIEGMPVAVKYQSGESWHRGQIVEIIPNKLMANILFVDFGNIESIDLLELRYLKRDYFIEDVTVCFKLFRFFFIHDCEIIIKTFRCRLFGIEFVTDKNFENVDKIFFIF